MRRRPWIVAPQTRGSFFGLHLALEAMAGDPLEDSGSFGLSGSGRLRDVHVMTS